MREREHENENENARENKRQGKGRDGVHVQAPRLEVAENDRE